MSVSLFWMALAVVAAPLIARLSRGRTPEVVVLLVLGVALGPHALGLATITGIEMIKQLGMGLLFLLAGMEIDLGANHFSFCYERKRRRHNRHFNSAGSSDAFVFANAIGCARVQVLREKRNLAFEVFHLGPDFFVKGFVGCLRKCRKGNQQE